ncbi:HAD family hydrolase [Tunicatimonas pelagia]|uniref:HAD family hydrolase n=1 Tax=Tunicatimonas pelagia TaxID=931531 RepID=UPI002665B8C2|nr:HAD family phosphatase [Tunicatimonas pelagia]WKN43227.1 HAD family phosphatase [Tunicatimonas pelagia]
MAKPQFPIIFARMDLSTIENIIFDLGGVIINLDTKATFDGFLALSQYTNWSQNTVDEVDLFLDYEKGTISSKEFRTGIREMTGNTDLSDEQIDEIWNNMLLDIPPARLELLQSLSEKYRLFVLSNTNAIHVPAFNQIVENVSGQSSINAFFEKVYFSHEVKMRKPEREIYEYVLNDGQLIPEETLFLDDKTENLVAAQEVGIRTFQITPEQDILSFFANP